MRLETDSIKRSTAVLVPAYNADAHLASVIADVKRVIPEERIIVVDDGSTDGTKEVARASGAVVVSHDLNRGKGAALKTGIDKAIELNMEWVITLDADGQHDPTEIPDFIECAARTGADIIVGDRMASRGNMPAIRIFANKTTSWFVSRKAHQHVPDSQNGYRMLRTRVFQHIRLETTRYDTESEMLIKAGRAGARIESIPVKTIYGSEISGVNPFIDTLRFFRMVLKSLFW